MTRVWMASRIVAVISLGSQAAPGSYRVVQVCMNAALLPPPAEYRAKAQVGAIFQRIAVDVKWAYGSGCGNGSIGVDAVNKAGPEVAAGAVASAMPFASGSHRISVFRDRLQAIIENRRSLSGDILAHVLAHEIGHILMETSSHADSGLMKARWTASDIERLRRGPMEFTSGHVQLIRNNFNRRDFIAGLDDNLSVPHRSDKR